LFEAGRSFPERMNPEYCLFATMTPPTPGGGEGQGSELSPALNNRFTVIFMENICQTNDQELFNNEISQICKNSVPESWHIKRSQHSSPCDILVSISWMTLQSRELPTFTLRNICRMIDFAFFMSKRHPGSSIATCIWTAFSIIVVAQLHSPQELSGGGQTLVEDVQQLLKSFDPNWQPILCPLIGDRLELNRLPEYILTPSRKTYADLILACIECGMSLLLEGPAATGKTTLITALAKWKDTKLERVNNTESTTIQDYLGCYLPDGKGFVFKKGPLYRAMEKGEWFLADEFNLADPSVMNLLVPWLEGKYSLRVPGFNKEIKIHSSFRFFACQNQSGYAKRKRSIFFFFSI
jgi:hypothetical protein